MELGTQEGSGITLSDGPLAKIDHMMLSQNEVWVIKNAAGNLLQSVAFSPAEIQVGWFRPDAPGKTVQGKKGPLTFSLEPKATTLLAALIAQLPSEFSTATVVSFTRPTDANVVA